MENQKRSSIRLFIRTLTPSISSIVGSVTVVLGIVGFHLLLLTNQPDLILPHVTGGSGDQLTRIYEDSILAPLDSLFGNSAMGVLSTVFLWGIVGWVVYLLIDFGIVSYQEWRQSDEDISYPGKNRFIRHPMHGQILIRFAVRFSVGLVAVASLFLFRPIIKSLFNNDILFLRASSPLEMFKYASIGIVSWLLVLHFYVVLFRLFAFRTRIFGEIIE